MGKYDSWDEFFESLEGDQVTLSFEELEAILGQPLPPSARRYQAWWSGIRTQTVWQKYGWSASPDLARGRVRFSRTVVKTTERRPSESTRSLRAGSARPLRQASVQDRRQVPEKPRLILVGCVKTKVNRPAPARDLYASPLWWRRRRYAESTGMPWVILSAEHGMVEPDTVLEPYDRYLGNEPASYRRTWSQRTADQVLGKLRNLGLEAVEVHAGAAYLNNGLEARLRRAGVEVFKPLEGLSFGEQLAWYD